MSGPCRIWERVYQIGGSTISESSDCSVYLVDVGNGEIVMIDCGVGKSFNTLLNNINSLGFDPNHLKWLILTHCHIDHIGAAKQLKEAFDCRILAHELDAEVIEGRNLVPTVAHIYGVKYDPVEIDHKIIGKKENQTLGDIEFHFIHTPGHTPGSMSLYIDINDKRILFAQDVHGPFDDSFGSDIAQWQLSMRKLLGLNADILCEGHFGIYQPREEVRSFIEGYLKRYS